MITKTLCAQRRALPFANSSRRSARLQASEGGPASAPPQPSRPAPGPRPVTGRPMPPPRPVPGIPPRPGVMLGPDGQPLEVVPVEKTGDDAWAGVARVDRGDKQESDWLSAAILAAGDLAALLVFAAAGRANHGEPISGETFSTALPFILGWFVTAPFLGGFGADARKKGVRTAALTAIKCWAVGIPAGVVLRGLFRGYVPPVPFIVVGLAVNGVLLVGWRSALAALTKQEETPSVKTRRDKRGNPLEFLELLMSLTKRW
ncbi:hypothetical protein VOLCADRAFT_120715 [Volvox carteri f. nagariensis]|uniref:DUF3054 domain-containing protein n=1 Tax=Volvox carteri f. nagariensis TaxID=3068 RepID=D8TS51_VOLCA|nr:uncharacterized protein VOLCADRAFT_120715 [Volvox carteri f. nagariensis]EFJ49633.1 hypothetical protein VOLCADRAFT_120715 [Volvox carteri f. nagariensis]|eukprot:XP_002949140.1 hypothetical protein VOLCADRAFT_120715 [Volvox carteri f. nagariensis]